MKKDRIKISDFAEVITGGTPSTSNPEYWDSGNIPWLQSGACQNDVITKCDTFITQKGLDNSAAKMMKPGSVLIALTGATTGKVGYLTFDACANQSVTGIQPNERFVSKYLYYYLRGIRPKILNDSYGGAQKHISQGYVKNIEVPLGPVEQQVKIAKEFEVIDTIIALRRQELHQFDDLIKARFVEMFGDPVRNEMEWQTKALEDVCKSIVDCPHSTPSYTSEDTGFMCIRTSIVKKNRIIWDEIEYIPEEEYIQRIQRKKPERGDVIYTREGAILGIAAVIDRDCNVALGQRSMLLSPNRSFCTPEFISVAMNFDSFLDNALKGLSGSASPHINVGDIKSFNMILPPVEQQEAFSAFVAQIEKSKSVIQKSLDETQLLFDSLMQEYFG